MTFSGCTVQRDYFSHRHQQRHGSAGLGSALVTPERRILPWEEAERTEGSSKSPLFSAFTRVASSSELALHSKNLWDSQVDTPPLKPLTHPHTHEQRGLGSTSKATSDEKPSKEEREKTPPQSLLQIREHYIWNNILSSLMQKRDRQLNFTRKHEHAAS